MVDGNQLCDLGHGTNDGEYGLAHQALRVHLILDTDEANPQVMKFIQGIEEVGHTARKAIELPHQHTVKGMAACGLHQRLELRPPLLAARDGERDPIARQRCIELYGYRCSVCKFTLEEVYGEIGREFIHVHHLRPLSGIAEEYEIDPVEDLRPVCPNCHAMLH